MEKLLEAVKMKLFHLVPLLFVHLSKFLVSLAPEKKFIVFVSHQVPSIST